METLDYGYFHFKLVSKSYVVLSDTHVQKLLFKPRREMQDLNFCCFMQLYGVKNIQSQNEQFDLETVSIMFLYYQKFKPFFHRYCDNSFVLIAQQHFVLSLFFVLLLCNMSELTTRGTLLISHVNIQVMGDKGQPVNRAV